MKAVKQRSFGNVSLGYKMLVPATLLILGISVYPLLNGFYLSMMNYNLFRPQETGFVGLQNIIRILTQDAEFYGVLGFSFFYTFGVVIIAYLFGLMLAMLLNQDIKYRGLFRALALIPWVIPPVVAATNWLWVLNDQVGVLNAFLMDIGIVDEPILFLADATLAKLTVIAVGVWKAFPFMMIVLLAGLQSIPHALYESAHMDGANALQAFRHITIPMIKGVSIICTTLMFIWTFNNFENIYLLTEGGPARSTFVVPILSYYMAFFRGRIGYASAISVVKLVAMLFLSWLYLTLLRKQEQ